MAVFLAPGVPIGAVTAVCPMSGPAAAAAAAVAVGGAVLPCGAAAADDCRRDQRIDRPRTAQRSAHQLT